MAQIKYIFHIIIPKDLKEAFWFVSSK